MTTKTRLAGLNLFSRKQRKVEERQFDVKLGDFGITAPIQRSWNATYTPQEVLDAALSPDLGSPEPSGDFPATPNNVYEYNGLQIFGDGEDERSDCRSVRSDKSTHEPAWKRIHSRKTSPETKHLIMERSLPNSPRDFRQMQSHVGEEFDGIIIVDGSYDHHHVYPDLPVVTGKASAQIVSTTIISHNNRPFNSFHFRHASARERIGSPAQSLNSMLSPVTEGFAKTGPSTFSPYSSATPLADEMDVPDRQTPSRFIHLERDHTSCSDSSAFSSPNMFHLDIETNVVECPGTAQSSRYISQLPSAVSTISDSVDPMQRSFSANSMRSVHGYVQGQTMTASATPFEPVERCLTACSTRSGLGSVTMSSQAMRGTEQDIVDRPSSRAAAPIFERCHSPESNQQRGRRAASVDPYDTRRRRPSDDYQFTTHRETRHGREVSNHTVIYDRQHETIEPIYTQTHAQQQQQRFNGPPSPHREAPKRSHSARPSTRTPHSTKPTHPNEQDHLAKIYGFDTRHNTPAPVSSYERPHRLHSPAPPKPYGSTGDIYNELSNDYAQIAKDLLAAHHETPTPTDDDRIGRTLNRLRSASVSTNDTQRTPSNKRSKSKSRVRPVVGFGLMGRGTDTESEYEDGRRRRARDAEAKNGAHGVVELVPGPDELWG